jgi:preprotein translocase subunit SecG
MQVMLIIIHVLVCVFLTLVVLLQQGNKQGMGAAFGGGSSTVFGGRGANTFLQKLTAGAAALFMVTSLTLSYMSSRTASAFDAEPEAGASEQVKPAPEDSAKKDEASKTPAPVAPNPATEKAP